MNIMWLDNFNKILMIIISFVLVSFNLLKIEMPIYVFSLYISANLLINFEKYTNFE